MVEADDVLQTGQQQLAQRDAADRVLAGRGVQRVTSRAALPDEDEGPHPLIAVELEDLIRELSGLERERVRGYIEAIVEQRADPAG